MKRDNDVNPWKYGNLGGKTMVRLEGLEPPTRGLEIRCSIQLSYRRNLLERNKLRFINKR